MSLAPGRVSPLRAVPAAIERPEYVGRPQPTPYLGPEVKDADTIAAMRVAGRIAAQALQEVGRHIEPGVSTDRLDQIGHELSGPICPWGVPRLQAARPITEFTAWLIEISKTTELSKRELWNLYGEFCLATDSNALTEGQVFRRIRTAGIARYRESVGSRRWRYKVETAQIISIQSPDPGS